MDLQRAVETYKFNLVTNMVGKFPGLQGIVGEKYALLRGEEPAVAIAIREHYMPISSEGDLPETAVGSVLAIADKLDSIFSFFAAGMIPSGSDDPHTLRRQAYGIVRVIESKRWAFPLSVLQETVSEAISKDADRFGIGLLAGQQQVIGFVKGRLRQLLTTKNIRHDVIEAVLNAEQKDLTKVFVAAQLSRQYLADEDFKPLMETLTRVVNLVKKAEPEKRSEVDPGLPEDGVEKELCKAVEGMKASPADQMINENYDQLVGLRPLIGSYFGQAVVMAEEPAVRENRLTQLNQVAAMALSLASLDQITTK